MQTSRQKHLNQALMRIPRRAESTDRYTLASTYVAAGSFAAMLNSTDHQILFGRRGTGKTHALYFLSDLVERTGDVVVYVDLRTVGSVGGLYADDAQSPAVRGTHLLVDVLEAIHEELLTVAVDGEVGDQTALLLALDKMVDAATEVEVIGDADADAGEPPDSPGTENRLRRGGTDRHRVLFGPLSRSLRAVVQALAPARLWVLLDEWSSVPLELQPLLADLLRRSVLPVPGTTVKIAAVERRSQFHLPLHRDYLGIEVGSDAASAVSLDDFMIFDHTQASAQNFFAQLFFNHAGTHLASMIAYPPAEPESFIDGTFRTNAFAELVRAAEGIPRDAINIAALAAQRAHDDSISIADVRRAARDWYLRDKQSAINANEPAQRALRLLVDEVVGTRRSRTFVLDQLAAAQHPTIDELYDARLLHVLRRGIVDRQNPGRLYDGFAIDYGCYVALLLDGESHFRPRDRGGWLNTPKGIPPDGFNLAKAAIDLSALDG